jgi:hypothetical protein
MKKDKLQLARPDTFLVVQTGRENAEEAFAAGKAEVVKRWLEFIVGNISELPRKERVEFARWGIKRSTDGNWPDLKQQFEDRLSGRLDPVNMPGPREPQWKHSLKRFLHLDKARP